MAKRPRPTKRKRATRPPAPRLARSRARTSSPRQRASRSPRQPIQSRPMNQLFYGDNLDVLRRHVADEYVDLVYLDPPFNSNANYNVLFGHADGTRAAAQIQAFGDTWRWDQAAAADFQDTIKQGGEVAEALRA